MTQLASSLLVTHRRSWPSIAYFAELLLLMTSLMALLMTSLMALLMTSLMALLMSSLIALLAELLLPC
jgi:hypothetical protein